MSAGLSSHVRNRRAMRRFVDLPCQVVSSRVDSPIDYHASDLSLDGMWLTTAEPLRTGETVVVCFEPQDGRVPRSGRANAEMLVFARVVRVQTHASAQMTRPAPVGMALELLDLSGPERRRLGQWFSGDGAPRLRLACKPAKS